MRKNVIKDTANKKTILGYKPVGKRYHKLDLRGYCTPTRN